MTPLPHAITPNETVVAAHTLMQRYSVRHLPVMQDGQLVGLVSDRDLLLGAQLAAPRKRIPIEEVMTAAPYSARADAPLAQVARTMSQRKLGSAVVVDGPRVVGILTTVDALRALADVLQGRSSRAERGSIETRPRRGRTRPLATHRATQESKR
jgi:acetoin utilization protein AcuB